MLQVVHKTATLTLVQGKAVKLKMFDDSIDFGRFDFYLAVSTSEHRLVAMQRHHVMFQVAFLGTQIGTAWSAAYVPSMRRYKLWILLFIFFFIS